jgi:plasmid stability protein
METTLSRNTYPSNTADRFMLRLPDGMRPALATRARLNRRSMNSEAVLILATVLGCHDEPVAGQSLQAAPATVPNETALQGGSSPTA